ncbi:MAG: serine hydrolase domain-containing protein [Chitinophagales bacterium]
MMWTKRVFTRFVILFLLVAIAFAINYCARAFPIISGYGAKVMCSGIFLAGRDEKNVVEEELGFFPVKYGHYTVNYSDSSVTGTVFGFAKQKAIYRHGLGATLISEITEDSLRKQTFHLASSPILQQDSLPWPLGNLINDSFPQAIDRGKLLSSVHKAFIEKNKDLPVRTRAVVVLYDGQLIAEEYANGFNRHSRLQGWSMTKSVVSALIGILARQGRLQIDSPAPVREWADPGDPRHSITVRDLLQQSSGLDFLENYAKASDATVMLYERADMGGFTAKHKLKQLPGSFYYYSSGNTNVLSRMIRQITCDSLYYAFPYTQLFYRIGMQSAIMEPDASGTFVGSSYMYATARDWARFGLLYASDGFWQGHRILPENWVKETRTPAPAAMMGEYGFQFWLNAGDKEGNRKYPHAPEDMFCADGYESQFIFIIPSRKMVIVRLGLTQHNNFDADHFVEEIVSSVR